MSEAYIRNGDTATLQAVDWLHLAAAPTFVIMALLSGVLGGGSPDMICSTAHSGSPLNSMVAMYGLMSAFHLAPWLRLISGQRNEDR